MGPTLLGFFLWACPRAVSWPLGVVYGLHVLFGNAMHTGTFVRVLVEFGQRRCARSFLVAFEATRLSTVLGKCAKQF